MEETKGVSHKWSALVTVSIGSFMASMDNVICSISFPRLTAVFQTEPSVVMWVTVAYLMVSTAIMIIIGRLGDLFGRKRIFILGLTIFTIGLLLCSLSQSIIQLILSRIVQGVGGGIILAVIVAIITGAFPDNERGKAIGILEAVISAGVLTGPVLGGVLLEAIGWRAIFYVRVPVGVIGLIMAFTLLREQKVPMARPTVDLWGAVTLFGGIACWLFFFNLGERFGLLSWLPLMLMGGGVILLILFFVQERRSQQPIVDLNLFRDRLFAGGNASFAIMSFSLAALIFLAPFYLMDGVGFSALETGSLIAVASVMSLFIGPLSGWLSDKIGTRVLRPLGITLISISLIVFSRLGIESGMSDVALGFVILGIGLGMFNPTTQSSIMGIVPQNRLGTAAAMMNTIRQIGVSVGTTVAGVIFANRQAFHLAQMARDNPEPQLLNRLSVVNGYRDTLLIAAIICGIGIITSLVGAKKKTNS
jgi:EmrB/QacA subfamily drug resistance transporter